MSVVTLDQMVPGESGKITRVRGKGPIQRRLVDMGITSGAVIDVVKPSPLGDPVEYRLRGYYLTLRRAEAKSIEVELINRKVIHRRKGQHLSGAALPLGLCKSGQNVEISWTRGGRGMRKKLQDMGLIPGSVLSVLQNDFPGPLIISLSDGTRLVIGKRLAMHILVKSS
jgi:ferrous iron transport protein A